MVVPDMAGWRRERMPKVSKDIVAFELAPDWVCEILSPSTAATDRADKMPIYAAEKVSHVWLIDPIPRTLEVFRLDGATYRVITVHVGDAVVRVEPFEAIELELGALWAE